MKKKKGENKKMKRNKPELTTVALALWSNPQNQEEDRRKKKRSSFLYNLYPLQPVWQKRR